MLGFSLNGVTLLSLSLVVGILVDDAIVEIENIMRHLGMGKTRSAAMEAADEIGSRDRDDLHADRVFLRLPYGRRAGSSSFQFAGPGDRGPHLAGRRPMLTR